MILNSREAEQNMIKSFFERIYMQIKGMRIMFFIPFIGYFVLIPIQG